MEIDIEGDVAIYKDTKGGARIRYFAENGSENWAMIKNILSDDETKQVTIIKKTHETAEPKIKGLGVDEW